MSFGANYQSAPTSDRYWWHDKVLAEVQRIGSYNTHGIASNVGMSRHDVERYVADLVSWGELEDCPPDFDYPARWVRATTSASFWEDKARRNEEETEAWIDDRRSAR